MENTVLILGAGFSKPYGYPTGPELVSTIIKNLKNSADPTSKLLASDLEDYGANSIDKFLHENPKHLDSGLQTIALAMMDAEIKSLGTEVKKDEDIINLLLSEVDESNFSKLRIISFNYDRLLEYKFLKKLGIKFGTTEKTQEIFKSLKIEHIHGRMPFLMGLESPADDLAFNYGCREHAQNFIAQLALQLMAEMPKRLHTIYTNNSEPNPSAVEAIKWAKRVFFVGFAYDEMNMQKLGINNPNINFDWEGKYVAGTSFSLPAVHVNRVQNKFPFLRNRLFPVNAKQFFQEKFDITSSINDSVKIEPKSRTCCETHAIQERPTFDHGRTTATHICSFCDSLISASWARQDSNSEYQFSIKIHEEWERNANAILFPRKSFTIPAT